MANLSENNCINCFNNELIIDELKIPSSYGFIAAKVWKNNLNNPSLKVLAIHGWQDNAGTFDRLFPLLESLNSMFIVAIDLPGHGSSSHLPKGVPYTDMTWIFAIKTVLDYLKWTDNVNIIAHSMGANASLEFAALYPDIVERLIMLDTIKPKIFRPKELSTELAKNISSYRLSEVFPSKSIFLYESDRTNELIIQTHLNGKLNYDGADCLRKRAVEVLSFNEMNNKIRVLFKRDPRLNCIIRRKFHRNQLISYLSNIRCRLMIIRAKNTHLTLKCEFDNEFIEFYRTKCKEFHFIKVDGDHYVHLTNPNNVSIHIDNFLRNAIQQLNVH